MDSLPVVLDVSSGAPGPTVGVLGGVHGDEYEGVIAARALGCALATELVGGRVRIAAPAHPAAWAARTRESPHDGKNLARSFPGRPDGGPTERVAHLLTEEVITGADLVIDLHSAGAGFEMPFLCGFQGGDDLRAHESRRCAEAFSARFTWEHDGVPAPGRSLSAATDLGIPAIYVESHGGRSLRAIDVQGYLDGTRRVLHRLGMLDHAPGPSTPPIRVAGDGNTDAGMFAPCSGYLVAHRTVGDLVLAGELVATIVDLEGRVSAEIVADRTAHVMLLRRDARVSPGDTVCILASRSDSP